MEFHIYATTSLNRNNVQETFNKMGGELAGICYMSGTLGDVIKQPREKIFKRAEMVKENRHHSVFDHEYITLYLQDVPKMFAMLLNNEKMYTTSEKSARYTQMNVKGIELDLYTKWKEIFIRLIKSKYGNEPYFDDKRIEKLAQENARYFLSVYTSTSLAYTTSYRQLNYLYTWLKNIENHPSNLIKKLKPTADKFCLFLEINHLVDPKIANLADEKGFSLIAQKDRKEYFGDVYSTNYYGSFAELAQAQRHRTLSYEIKELNFATFYVPKIIRDNETLKTMWVEDMLKVKDITPQGQIVQIFERGTPENFILKLKERLCTCAQLEINDQTKATLEKYIKNTDDAEVKAMLEKYNKGARCTSGFKCNTPCKFADGINLDREI